MIICFYFCLLYSFRHLNTTVTMNVEYEDMFLNACLSVSPEREMKKTLRYFKRNDVTQKQVNLMLGKQKLRVLKFH